MINLFCISKTSWILCYKCWLTHNDFRLKIPSKWLWEIAQLILSFGESHLLFYCMGTHMLEPVPVAYMFHSRRKYYLNHACRQKYVTYTSCCCVWSYRSKSWGANNSFFATTANNISPKLTHTHSSINYLSFLVTLRFLVVSLLQRKM